MPGGERVAWLGIILAVFIGLLSMGLQKTEMQLQFAATSQLPVDVPTTTTLPDIESRLVMLVIAESLFLVAILFGLGARRTPLFMSVGVVFLVIGTTAAVVGVTNIGDPALLTKYVSLPALPLAVLDIINHLVLEIQ